MREWTCLEITVKNFKIGIFLLSANAIATSEDVFLVVREKKKISPIFFNILKFVPSVGGQVRARVVYIGMEMWNQEKVLVLSPTTVFARFSLLEEICAKIWK